MKQFLQDKKYLLILLLGALFIIKIPQEGPRFIFWVLCGIIVAASCDFFVKRFFSKQKALIKSAVISGFIVSGIIDYNQPWFILVIFSVLAIFSKHVIRFKGKHIFNPANFGLFAASLFGIPLTWNIESNIYLIIPIGIYLAFSLKKIPHILGFLIFFAGLLIAKGVNPFLLVNWFFIFIMLIEPKTSGFGNIRGFLFGSIAAITAFLIYTFFPGYDFFIGSLFIANLFNPLLERIKR